MTPLDQPRTVKAAILRELIIKTEISERQLPFNSFRSRISDLKNKHRLNVRFKEKKAKNSFGHPMTFRVHYLWMKDLPKARRLYKEINAHG